MATKNHARELFLDTSYTVALAAPSDLDHERAKNLAAELRRTNNRMVTTRAVALEMGNALAGLRYRSAGVRLLNALDRDPLVDVVRLDDELYDEALRVFASRGDKGWGLVDCVSFVVMSRRGITDALTADVHFQQAGFRALMRETSSA